MTAADWHDRWATGRTGWHETDGNAGLRAHWNFDARRVLVPLCGKTPDLVWLAKRGHEVVGVELSDIAIREFFAEHSRLDAVEVEADHLSFTGSLGRADIRVDRDHGHTNVRVETDGVAGLDITDLTKRFLYTLGHV